MFWTDPLLMKLETNDIACFAVNVIFHGHTSILINVLVAIPLCSDSEEN